MPFRKNRKKTLDIYQCSMTVTYTCGECGEVVTKNINPDFDLSAWQAECDMCGSHGEVYVSVDCPKCGRSHKIILQSS